MLNIEPIFLSAVGSWQRLFRIHFGMAVGNWQLIRGWETPVKKLCSYAKAVLLLLVVFLTGIVSLQAQEKTVAFGFEYEGKHQVCTVLVDMYYGHARSSVISSGFIEVEDEVESMVLAFYGFRFKEATVSNSVKLLIRPSFLSVSGILRAEPISIELKPGSSPRQIPLVISGRGKGRVQIKQLAVKLPNGEEVQADLFSPFTVDLEIKSPEKPADIPSADPDSTIAKTTETSVSTASPCDREWERRDEMGIKHEIWHVRTYLKEPCSEKIYKSSARKVIIQDIRSGNKNRTLAAAELYWEYYKGSGYDLEVKQRVNEFNQPVVKEDELAQAKKEYSEIEKMTNVVEKEKRLIQFINDYSTPRWREKAKELVDKAKPLVHTEIEIIGDGSEESLRNQIFLNYAVAPVIESISDSTNVKVTQHFEDGRHWLHVNLVKDGDYHIYLVDPKKIGKYQRYKVRLGGFPSILTLKVSGDTLFGLRISGGKPPFRMDFYKDNQRLNSLDIDRGGEFHYDKETLGKLLGGQNGDITVRIVEPERNLFFNGGYFTIPKPKFPWLIVGTAALLIFVTIGIRSLQKKAHRKEYEEKLKKAQEDGTALIEAETALEHTLENPTTLVETQSEMANPFEEQKAPILEKQERPRPSTLVIKKHKIAAEQKIGVIEQATDFHNHLDTGDYFKFDLTGLWHDTAISELHFRYKSVVDLSNFLRSQNIKELKEKEGTIPEIGGFLLGKFFQDPDNQQFKVAVEEFVPVSPKMHNVYKLEFSTSGIAHELGEAQDQFPELALVAWFHTHPGHGLFLSSPDLTIHEGFFKEKYQFAMEIDSLTDNLDTGFFTRTMAGKTNNRQNLKPSARWFDWVEIEEAPKMN